MDINITDVFVWTAATFSIILYISPLPKYLQLCKKQIRFNEAPNVKILSNYITGINWLIYAYKIKNLPFFICYLVACFSSFIFIMTFLFYIAKVKLLKVSIFILILFLYTLTMYLSLAVLNRNINMIGYICIAFSFISFYYPITLIKNVIKFRNSKYIPIKLCVVNLIVTTCWIIYGFMIVNFHIIIQNFIGMIFTFILMFIWKIFKKRKPISENSNFSFSISRNRPETTVNVI